MRFDVEITEPKFEWQRYTDAIIDAIFNVDDKADLLIQVKEQ